MDRSCHLRELGADVVGVGLDFAAHADEELARLAASIIGDTHVGGCDDLHALEATGELDALLAG